MTANQTADDTQTAEPVTLQLIAERMGLNKGTVSRALREDPRVRAETIARVRAVAAEMGYDPTRYASARRLAMRRHGKDLLHRVVGAVMPANFERSHYHLSIYCGIMEVVQGRDFAVLTSFMDPPDAPAERSTTPISQLVAQGEIDGLLVIWSRSDFHQHLAELRKNRRFGDRPIVSVLYSLPNCHSVLTDESQGGYDLAMHVLGLGHRQIVQLVVRESHATDENMHRRIAGIEMALRHYGLDPASHLKLLAVPIWWLTPYTLPEYETPTRMHELETSDYGMEIINFFRAHPEITVSLGANDACAVRLWHLLRHLGYRLPEQMSIAGYDDTDTRLLQGGPSALTSVRLPLEEIGKMATSMLLSQIDGNAVATTSRVLLPTQLVPRETTVQAPA